MSQRDWNAYKAFFADKAILTTIWQEPNDLEPKVLTNSITEFLAQTENGPDSQPIFGERPIKINITREGNLANAWVYYEAKFGTEDNLLQWKGYDLFSLLKFNGKWHIISITYLSDD
jgi:glutathionylspermidine synthase